METSVVLRAEAGRALRHPKSFALLGLFVCFTLLVLLLTHSVTSSLHQFQRALADRASTPTDLQRGAEELKTPLIWLLFGGDAGVVARLKDVPALVLVVFKAMLQFLPLYAALLGFDQVSTELSSRSLRYLTVRARRSSILFGKLASQTLLLFGVVALLVAGLFVWAAATVPGYSAGAALTQGLQFGLAALAYVVTWVSLAMFWSVSCAHAPLSLVMNLCTLGLLWSLDVLGTLMTRLGPDESPVTRMIGLVRFLSPFHYVPELLQHSPSRFLLGILAQVAFAGAFAAGAWAVFRRRDL